MTRDQSAIAHNRAMADWMIYGANGYTGELIARRAVAEGKRPVLAGRDARRIGELGAELGLETRAFDLHNPDLRGIAVVLHCAGPFIHTSAPMVDACLASRAHYLDITGEIDVFESVYARGDEARAAGISLISGVGFDVVPTDCLGALLSERLPDANELWLAFSTSRGSSISRGTMRTMIENLGRGGAIRQDGRIVRVPTAFEVREIPFHGGARSAVTIPWGDVSSAYRTTGIPNIRVYTGISKRGLKRIRRLARIERLLAFRPLRMALLRMAPRSSGPTTEQRQRGSVELWGRVSNGRAEKSLAMTTPDGYELTAAAALLAVERVLDGGVSTGALTPSQAFGTGFALALPGVFLHE